MKIYKSFSSEETKRFSERLAKTFLKLEAHNVKRKKAAVFALQGELGAGKTTFTQGFLRGFGVKKRTTSPTFIIFRRFKLHVSGFKSLYHMDAYRLKKIKDLGPLEFDVVLNNPQNIVLIEWAERIKNILPRGTKWIRFQHGKKEHERSIKI